MTESRSLEFVSEIKTFIARTRPAERKTDIPTNVDLDEIFQDPEMAANARLWHTPNGELKAYAFVHFPYNNLNFEIDPSHLNDALEDEILAWAEGRMRAQYGMHAPQQTLDCTCRADDTRKALFLSRYGFEKTGVETLSYLIDLSAALPEPLLPPGFTLRALDPETELLQAVDLFQAAYGTDNFTLEERLAMMNTDAYLPELDVVVLSPEGRLAGNCICGIEAPSPESTGLIGFTDPLVVHPDFQRKGLAAALLLYGLEKLSLRGVRQVRLGTSSTNAGMRRAAEAAGFRCAARHAWYSKKV